MAEYEVVIKGRVQCPTRDDALGIAEETLNKLGVCDDSATAEVHECVPIPAEVWVLDIRFGVFGNTGKSCKNYQVGQKVLASKQAAIEEIRRQYKSAKFIAFCEEFYSVDVHKRWPLEDFDSDSQIGVWMDAAMYFTASKKEVQDAD